MNYKWPNELRFDSSIDQEELKQAREPLPNWSLDTCEEAGLEDSFDFSEVGNISDGEIIEAARSNVAPVRIGAGLSAITSDMVGDRDSLISVIVDPSVRELDIGAFCNCPNLE